MPRLLITLGSFRYGGAEQSVLHWSRRLSKRWKVWVLGSPEVTEMLPEFAQEDKYERVYCRSHRYVPSLIRKHKIDLVHVHQIGKEYIKDASKLCPVVQTIFCPRVDMDYDYDYVEKIIVASQWLYKMQKGNKTVIIEHPIDIKTASPRISHWFKGKGKTIVGSMWNRPTAMTDFNKVSKCFKDVKFHEKPLGIRLPTYTKLCTIESYDIFLHPTSNEGYGVVFLEAMALGVPIVTYDNSAIREVVQDAGLYARDGKWKDLRDAVGRLIDDRYLREWLGENGKRIVAERNNPLKIAHKYEEVYNGITGKGA